MNFTENRNLCFLSLVTLFAASSVSMSIAADSPPTPALNLAPPYVCSPSTSETVCAAYATNVCDTNSMPPDLCAEKLKSIAASDVVQHKSFFKRLFEKFDVADLSNTILSVIAAVMTALATAMRTRLATLAKRLGDPVIGKQRKITYETRAVNLLIVGEGGSGKTSIIRALSGSGHAQPAKSTEFPTTYSIVHEINVQENNQSEPKRMLERIYAKDYQGQDAGQLEDSSDLQNREEIIKSTILILVVDLFPFTGPNQAPQKDFDLSRIEHQIVNYQDIFLELIFKKAKHLQHIVLFINKIDLVLPRYKGLETRILDAYKPLIDRLRRVGRHYSFNTIIGAAARGEMIVGFDDSQPEKTLYEVIKKFMVPIDGEN